MTPATASRRASTAAPRRAAEAAPIEDVTEAQVRELLATVHDPEIPAVSIVDLGVVEGVAVTAASI